MAKAKDTVTVRLPGEHRAVSWSGGAFAGDPELVSTAQGLAAIAAQVEVAPPGVRHRGRGQQARGDGGDARRGPRSRHRG